MNIVLIGFMGSGKSSVGKSVSKLLNLKFVDTDKLIEKASGLSINEIFSKYGQETFRDMEKEAIEAVGEKNNLVISCGGGVILKDINITNLKKKGFIVYLKTSSQIIFKRIKTSKNRPLLKNISIKNIETMMEERKSKYEIADFTIDTDALSVKEIAQKIADKFQKMVEK